MPTARRREYRLYFRFNKLKCLVPGTWCQVYDPATKYLVPNTQHPIPNPKIPYFCDEPIGVV